MRLPRLPLALALLTALPATAQQRTAAPDRAAAQAEKAALLAEEARLETRWDSLRAARSDAPQGLAPSAEALDRLRETLRRPAAQAGPERARDPETGKELPTAQEQAAFASRRAARAAELDRRWRAPRPASARRPATQQPAPQRGGPVFTVNTAYDDADATPGDGACNTGFTVAGVPECTLRAAIQEANASPGTGPIAVNLDLLSPDRGGFSQGYDSATDRWTIRVSNGGSGSLGALPAVTRANVTIDGEQQQTGSSSFSGASCSAPLSSTGRIIKVLLDGADVPSGNGLVASAGGFTVRGVAIGNFPADGVQLRAPDGIATCVHAGVDAAGFIALGNFDDGVQMSSINGRFENGTSSGNGYGVYITPGATGAAVNNAEVGTDAEGAAAISNFNSGVSLNGADPVLSNSRVSGNGAVGVDVLSGSNGAALYNNVIGLGRARSFLTIEPDVALPNVVAGVRVQSGAQNVEIGDSGSSGNVIAGNTGAGISVGGGTAVRVRGNAVGIGQVTYLSFGSRAYRDAAFANGGGGIVVTGGTGVVVGIGPGQSGAGYGNRIGGHPDGDGVRLATSSPVVVAGNTIGELELFGGFGGAPTPVRLGNDVGVRVAGGGGHTIGGLRERDRNVIGLNTYGVLLAQNTSGNAVVGNTIGLNAAGNAVSFDGRVATQYGNAVGVYVAGGASNNTVGGAAPGARNVISGNGLGVLGISFTSASGLSDAGSGNAVLGNWVGLSANGLLALGNQGQDVFGSGYGIAVPSGPGFDVGRVGAGNVVAGHRNAGILAQGEDDGGQPARIRANTVGLDPSGLLRTDGTGASFGNDTGIWVFFSPGTVVGGRSPGEGNRVANSAPVDISGAGVFVQENESAGTQVLGNTIGLDAVGTAAGNAVGVLVRDFEPPSSAGTLLIEANTISGNTSYGVWLDGTEPDPVSRVTLLDNRIGTDAAGLAARQNGGDGILAVDVEELRIGNTDKGNVISGNSDRGIFLDGGSSIRIYANKIGVAADGVTSLGNGRDGIRAIGSTRNLNIGGGGVASLRNVISGNFDNGVFLSGALSSFVGGNYIGTDASGTAAVPNRRDGVRLWDGFADGSVQTNVISGNLGDGVNIEDVGTSRNSLYVNLIGVAADGLSALGNGGDGVSFDFSAQENLVGGDASVRNTIAFNGGAGIIAKSSGYNSFLANAIYANGGLGIDLGDNGVTPNDGAGDPDAGPNDLTNYPILTGVARNGPTATVQFQLQAEPNQAYRVELFTSESFDPSGFGEGQAFAQALTTTTDGSGTSTVSTVLPGTAFPVGRWVTATATPIDASTRFDHLGTSEFSNAVQVSGPSVTLAADVLLQGPYTGGGQMRAAGAALPESQPFAAAQYNGTPLDYDGTELYTGSGSGITDWVLVELRQTPSGPAVARRAALLQTDGDVVSAADGASPVSFGGVAPGSYYVVVRHRNHLPAMTPAAVALPGTADLTAGSFGTGGQATVAPGVRALWAGDLNADGLVTALDFNAYSAASAALATGYVRADLNGDGLVTALDFNAFNAASASLASSTVPD